MEAEPVVITLKSEEGDSFPIPAEVARISELVKGLLDDNGDEDSSSSTEIPLPKVKAPILKKIVEYCNHYHTEPMTEIKKPLKSADMSELVQEWYAEFVKVEQQELFDVLLAANYMDIKPLLDLTSATVASMIKNKTIEEIRETFKKPEGATTTAAAVESS